MNAREVRDAYLSFFEERGHARVPSSPVIPHGDRTLLFTNAGMNQFKDYFTGREKPKFPRATTAQKCIRAGGKHNDLDNVGYTTRHLTFFEMLGNFSFGDYFKKEAIGFAWDLVTKRFGISPSRLWITVYKDDSEARDLWRRIAGVSPDRIVGLGEKDNFWSMGDTGPCGPCSEILIDRGDAHGPADMENGERFFEIWNLVFMQFDQKADGTRAPLPRPSIDTGMGLERMSMVLQGVDSVFETDVFRKLIRRVEEITGTPYDAAEAGVPHRVIADHIRSLTFAFADGAEPSNEGRGYVLRRILRRAARYARKIHTGGPVLHLLVEDLVKEMGGVYPEIVERREYITRVIQNEEERFGETLDKGIALFDDVVAGLKKKGAKTIPGGEVFKLYDTFGFPADLVERMASEIGFTVDSAGFEKLMEGQKERSRGASQFHVVAGDGDALELDKLPETRFTGYERAQGEAEVQACEEQAGGYRVVLSETPFYGESGGQVGDAGTISGRDFVLDVEDTQKERGRFIHYCKLREGDRSKLRKGGGVTAAIDAVRRAAIERNHTATHLLHAALRSTVGTHVHQKGSLVDPTRLRFDVTHYAGFTSEEVAKVEQIVRRQILANTPVETFETSHDDAVKRGAMALFGEKYGDRVRCVKIGDFSLELCGGTHVRRTGDIGPFVVAGEGSVSSGVRRLEALTALGADELHEKHVGIVSELSRALKVAPDGLVQRIQKLLDELKDLKAKQKSGGAPAAPAAVRREKVGNTLLAGGLVGAADGKSLRELYDGIKKEAEHHVATLFATGDGKVQVLVAVSVPLVKLGLDAREIFQAGAAKVGARGGGRAEKVEAGGSQPEGVEAAMADMLAFARGKLPGGA
jgi:alanyl-tRNA synthetase